MAKSDVPAKSIVLIGMPGCGKSTVGVLLAKALALGFTDTDLLMQEEEGRTLQEIVDQDGYEGFRRVEARVLTRLPATTARVIATGGSAVYSEEAMAHLKQIGVVVFLDISLASVRRRIGDFSLRGVSKRPDQSLDHLFDERHQLYCRYADVVVSGEKRSQDEVCQAVIDALPTSVFDRTQPAS